VGQPDQQVAESGERAMFIADISFGVAALFGFTALALYLLPDDEPAPGQAAKPKPWYAAAATGKLLQF
jgi:hypothetical protein